jgi:hypothetical protein
MNVLEQTLAEILENFKLNQLEAERAIGTKL